MITFRDELFGSLTLDEKNMHACMHAGRVACLGCVCWHIHLYIYIYTCIYVPKEIRQRDIYYLVYVKCVTRCGMAMG